MSELKQAIKKYGQVPCKFSHYYKYEFTFIGNADDGTKIVITIGGNHNDIYRLDVSAEEAMTLAQFECHGWADDGCSWSLEHENQDSTKRES